MSALLYVFREYRGSYQRVGALQPDGEAAVFSYAPEYLSDATATSISVSLPLQSEAFDPKVTRSFFEGLLPEGELRRLLADALHITMDAYAELLARLNNESIGALVFCTDESGPDVTYGYEAFTSEDLRRFSQQPARIALDTTLTSRLSLAGAQTKIGLYHTGDDTLSGWFLPQGLAPSTHIVKASSETFPLQTINEEFCLLAAQYCGLNTARSFLISVGETPPLLAVERFDRIFPADPRVVDGLVAPQRLHQEDMCQAAGIPAFLKYEPTDGHYLSLVVRTLNRAAEHPLEDRLVFFEQVLFDYLIGNCDNHLKNYSLLWSEDWSLCRLAPLYDVTCTTRYSELAHEMGIALCESRRIDDVTQTDIRHAARSVGIVEEAGWQRYLDLCKRFPQALKSAESVLVEQGFAEAADIGQFISKDSAPRCALG